MPNTAATAASKQVIECENGWTYHIKDVVCDKVTGLWYEITGFSRYSSGRHPKVMVTYTDLETGALWTMRKYDFCKLDDDGEGRFLWGFYDKDGHPLRTGDDIIRPMDSQHWFVSGFRYDKQAKKPQIIIGLDDGGARIECCAKTPYEFDEWMADRAERLDPEMTMEKEFLIEATLICDRYFAPYAIDFSSSGIGRMFILGTLKDFSHTMFPTDLDYFRRFVKGRLKRSFSPKGSEPQADLIRIARMYGKLLDGGAIQVKGSRQAKKYLCQILSEFNRECAGKDWSPCFGCRDYEEELDGFAKKCLEKKFPPHGKK